MKQKHPDFTAITPDELINYLETINAIPDYKRAEVLARINTLESSTYTMAMQLFTARTSATAESNLQPSTRNYSNER